MVRGDFFWQTWTLGNRSNRPEQALPRKHQTVLCESPRLLAEHLLAFLALVFKPFLNQLLSAMGETYQPRDCGTHVKHFVQ